ncbi:uncharacterized protein PgNI_01618 [Pyricularia grisea]|uniref:Sulfhydryl oxidase n=1 Tax=Pyricularia grisea TaxID=148305 RepID=A0A6P8BK76_PYRGI|nr:uncharacterized protein PgNI_01618 [Pyricularia grisea]TLD17203.1 hypothetical protein PgNI_01618 [Pyricularia grisea]
MAGDSSEPEPKSQSPQSTTAGGTESGPTSTTTPKLANGVVLGKDGKPCRTCTSMKDWAAQSKSLLKSPAAQARPPRDCPADVETLGRGTWTLLHTIAAQYPEKPTQTEQSDLAGFMRLFSKLYPCWVCADDFREYIKREPLRVRTRDEFGNWLCNAHNDVNKKLGKPIFDCNLWDQRWRTGVSIWKMADTKRKNGPGASDANSSKRRKQGGNGGKWQTSHQKTKIDGRVAIELGDVGVWVTCARNQEAKAAREVEMLFDEYVEKLYGIKPPGEEDDGSDNEGGADDIEASIQKELTSLKPTRAQGSERVFNIVRQAVDCLLFVKTKTPIEPVEFVHRICLDTKASSGLSARRFRYLNRFTPITLMGRASDKGFIEVCQKVLPQHFKMSEASQDAEEADIAADDRIKVQSPEEAKKEDKEQSTPPECTYAIRLSTRNQCPLKRDDVIKGIASLIDDQRHKVNLTKPDKVILVDMFQNLYGMSVVDGDWDDLKRFNISEIYSAAAKLAKADSLEHPKGSTEEQK